MKTFFFVVGFPVRLAMWLVLQAINVERYAAVEAALS